MGGNRKNWLIYALFVFHLFLGEWGEGQTPGTVKDAQSGENAGSGKDSGGSGTDGKGEGVELASEKDKGPEDKDLAKAKELGTKVSSVQIAQGSELFNLNPSKLVHSGTTVYIYNGLNDKGTEDPVLQREQQALIAAGVKVETYKDAEELEDKLTKFSKGPKGPIVISAHGSPKGKLNGGLGPSNIQEILSKVNGNATQVTFSACNVGKCTGPDSLINKAAQGARAPIIAYSGVLNAISDGRVRIKQPGILENISFPNSPGRAKPREAFEVPQHGAASAISHYSPVSSNSPIIVASNNPMIFQGGHSPLPAGGLTGATTQAAQIPPNGIQPAVVLAPPSGEDQIRVQLKRTGGGDPQQEKALLPKPLQTQGTPTGSGRIHRVVSSDEVIGQSGKTSQQKISPPNTPRATPQVVTSPSSPSLAQSLFSPTPLPMIPSISFSKETDLVLRNVPSSTAFPVSAPRITDGLSRQLENANLMYSVAGALNGARLVLEKSKGETRRRLTNSGTRVFASSTRAYRISNAGVAGSSQGNRAVISKALPKSEPRKLASQIVPDETETSSFSSGHRSR